MHWDSSHNVTKYDIRKLLQIMCSFSAMLLQKNAGLIRVLHVTHDMPGAETLQILSCSSCYVDKLASRWLTLGANPIESRHHVRCCLF